MAKEEEKEEKYLGVTYLNVQSSNPTPELFEAIEKFVMDLDKCRMLVYTSIQTGQPHCGPQGCNL
jgi:hypothetical protein